MACTSCLEHPADACDASGMQDEQASCRLVRTAMACMLAYCAC